MINNSPEVSPNGKIELFTQPANGSAARQLPPAIAALKQEITTRKQTEAALKASEELFRHVINSISDHIYVTRIRADGSRVNLYLSPHVQALTGYPMEKFINNWDFWPSTVIHPKDQARATVQAQALAAGEDSEVEYRLVRADGSIIWVRDSGRVTRTPATGELTVYGIISNVSRRKLAELENMWLHNQFHRQAEEIEQYANRLNVFYELDRAIATKLRPDDIYHAFSAHAARLLPYDCMTIALAKDSHIQIAYATNPQHGPLKAGAVQPYHNSAMAWVINRGQPLLRHHISQLQFAEDQELMAGGIKSYMIIPLKANGKVTGTCNLGSHQIGAYQVDDLETAQSMADQFAMAFENARLFEQVKAGQEELRQLAHQIIAAQEAERQRLSHELHDEAGQSLTVLKLWLESMADDLPAKQQLLRERMAEAIDLTATTMHRLRALARDLRSPALTEAGFNDTLADLCHDFSRRAHLPVEYTSAALPPLPEAAQTCLYRFVQEALTNIAKHAGAGHAWVTWRISPSHAALTVRDNGRGFALNSQPQPGRPARGMGLLGIKERLELLRGRLEILSQPGQGAELTAHIPLECVNSCRGGSPQ